MAFYKGWKLLRVIINVQIIVILSMLLEEMDMDAKILKLEENVHGAMEVLEEYGINWTDNLKEQRSFLLIKMTEMQNCLNLDKSSDRKRTFSHLIRL